MNLTELASFLFNANQVGYSTGDYSNWIKEKDGSTSIVHQEKDWEMHDNFFGGEPFGGRLVVFYKKNPVWMMVYYGYILDNNKLPIEKVYKFLQKSLVKTPKNFPIRGPKKFIENEFIYKNSWQGKINQFTGEERIFVNNEEIYQANYLGGLINLKSG
jgi:hypothetical protein